MDFYCWLGLKKSVIIPVLGTGVLVWDGHFLKKPRRIFEKIETYIRESQFFNKMQTLFNNSCFAI